MNAISVERVTNINDIKSIPKLRISKKSPASNYLEVLDLTLDEAEILYKQLHYFVEPVSSDEFRDHLELHKLTDLFARVQIQEQRIAHLEARVEAMKEWF